VKNGWLILGVIFIAGAGIWRFFIADYWTIRIPKDWSFQAEYLGTTAYPDESGKLPEKHGINIYRKVLHVKEWSQEQVIIKESYSIYDIHTGAVTWEVKLEFTVNPETGKVLEHPGHPEAAGLYYLFPKNMKKIDYQHFNYYLNAYTLSYDREETVGGMPIYVYRFSGVLDFTEIYQGSDEFPGVIPPSGQRIKSSNKFLNEFWVEPKTGEVVKIIEDGPVDYFVDVATGTRLQPVLAWSGKTTGNTVESLTQRVKEKLFLLQLHKWRLPGTFLFFGLACLFIGIWSLYRTHSYQRVTN